MANLGCILGCITVEAGVNDSLHWTEDPAGAATAKTTTVAAGDYFPDSATVAEQLRDAIEDAMNTASAIAWTVTIGSDGRFVITAGSGEFRLDIAADSDTLWTEAGFGTADVTSSSSVLTAGTPPQGTIYWNTVDGNEELRADSLWKTHPMGSKQITTDGKLHKRTWGSYQTRELVYDNIAGPEDFSYPHGDIERAQTCWEEHWQFGKRVRVFPAKRTITDAVPADGYAAFEAQFVNEAFEPRRVDDEIDWWTWEAQFHRWVD